MNFFSYVLRRFHQNLSRHLIIEQIPTMLEFWTRQIKSVKSILNPGQDWREMQICDYQIFQRKMRNTESFADVKSNCRI